MNPALRELRRLADQAKNNALRLVRRGTLGVITSTYFAQLLTEDDSDTAAADRDTYDDVECWQHYGLASRPPKGAEVIALMVGGRGEGATIVAETDRAHRPAIANEEVAVYGKRVDTVQAIVLMKTDGDIDVKAGAGKIAHLGGTGGEPLHKATAFDTAHEQLLDDVKTLADTLKASVGIAPPGGGAVVTTPAIITAATALSTQCTTFISGQSGRRTTKSKAE